MRDNHVLRTRVLRKQIAMVTSKPSVSRDLFSALDRFTSCNSDLEFLEKRLVEFDAFSFLGVAVTEDVHSKVLAWLLNPRGSHGTRDYFLKKFLVETGSATQEQLREADWSDTVVQREWHNEVDGSLGGQIPGCGVRVRHPDCTAQAAADCVSGASCSASCFVVTPGVR